MAEKRSITLHTNEVNDLIGDIPAGIVFRGAVVIILTTMALIVLAGLIPYPQLLRGNGRMVSDRTAVVKLDEAQHKQLRTGQELVMKLDEGRGQLKTIRCSVSGLGDHEITITAGSPEDLSVLKQQLSAEEGAPVYIVLKERNLRQAIFSSLAGYF